MNLLDCNVCNHKLQLVIYVIVMVGTCVIAQHQADHNDVSINDSVLPPFARLNGRVDFAKCHTT